MTDKLREAAQQARAFTMRDFASLRDFEAAKAVLHDNLCAALAQEPEPVQEQVAWMVYTLDGKSVCVTDNPADFTDQHRVLPLYTAPPQRPRLTDEEIDSIHIHLSNTVGSSYKTLARAIERKVRGE